MAMLGTCPYCGSGEIDAHFVDIGVGLQQASVAQCLDCGAHEFDPYDDNSHASPEEQALGWYKGDWEWA